MKNIVKLIFVFIISTNVFSQNICGEIEYTYKKNIAYLYIEHYKMIFNNNAAYSKEVLIKKTDTKKTKQNSEKGITKIVIPGRKNLTPAFFYNNRESFYFSEVWDDDILIVKESPFNWQWKLHNETKKIGNFNCQKATIKFRGQNYTAWFTNEIPVPFGPWKFKGLSGLILEVYNTDKTFHITADKIKISNNSNCLINFDKTQLKNPLTIPQYLEKQKELVKAVFAKMSSKLPKGAKPLKLDENCEDCSKGKIEIFNEKN